MDENKDSEQLTEQKADQPLTMDASQAVVKRKLLMPPSSKRRKIIAGAVLLLIVVVGVAIWQFTGKDTPAVTNQSTPEARLGVAVTLIDGMAKYSTDGTNWTALTTDTNLKESDWVQTEAASRVVLTLDDGSAIRLDESSTIGLASLATNDIVIDNEQGEVYSRVVASERSFSVNVAGTAYNALGTAYKTTNSQTVKGVQVYQSSVKAGTEGTQVDEGKQFFKSHTDANLTDKVTDLSVDEMKSDSFMVWNLEQDKQHGEFKDKLGVLTKIEEQPAPTPTPELAGASIKLTGKQSEKGVTLSWSVTNIGSPEGFKVVRSKKSSTPTYGKDDAAFASGSSTRSYTWKDGSGVTYHYRVCAYKGGTCSTYSNAVSLTSPYTPPEAVVPGTVTLGITGNTASWSFTGTAPHGFKGVVSTSPGATYPGSYKFYSGGTSYDLSELGLSSNTYYVRVCKYTASSEISGGCTDYSDDVQWIVP